METLYDTWEGQPRSTSLRFVLSLSLGTQYAFCLKRKVYRFLYRLETQLVQSSPALSLERNHSEQKKRLPDKTDANCCQKSVQVRPESPLLSTSETAKNL